MQVLSSVHSASGNVAVAARPGAAPAQPLPSEPAPSAACGPCTSGAPGPADTGGQVAAGAARWTYSHSERTTLHIETRDGDVVRVKLSARESADVATRRTGEEGADSLDLALRTRSSSRLSIRVQGDLDADELAAIQEAIEQAGALADDFFDGDLQAAFTAAAELDVDGEELAKVSMRMRSSERLTYAGYGYGEVPMLPWPANTPDLAPSSPLRIDPPAEPDPVEAVAVAAAEPEPEAEPPVAVDAPDPAPAPAEAEAEATPEPGPEPAERDVSAVRADAFRAIGGFLGRLMDSLAASPEAASTGQLDLSLKLRVFQATLTTLTEAREGQEEVPALVHDTLDALAAQQAAPLDRVA